MRRQLFLMACGLFTSILAAAAPQSAAQAPRSASPPAEQELRANEKIRFAAMVSRDLAVIDRLLAPELIYTHGDGRVIDKAAFIADLKTGDFKYVSIDPLDIRVRLFGDTAIVAGEAAMQVVNKGVPAQIRIRYTNTQLRRNGAWQMVAWQATRLSQ
jgi:hypothetical protein